MTIYIGVVTYNSRDDLPSCFAGICAQACPDLRVVVCDNASSDGSVAWLRQHAPEADLIVNDHNFGYGRAHNRIIQSIELQPGDCYLTLNPDVELSPNYVTALLAAIADQPEIGWATGKLFMKTSETGGERLLYSAGHAMLRSGFAFNIGYGLPDAAGFSQSREVFGAPGAAALYKAELVHAVSENGAFFDPGLFMYAEDTDVDWRARRQGWRCWYCADATADHRGSQPTGWLKMTAVGNRYVSILKNALLPDLLLFNLPYMAAHCLARLVVTPALGARLIAQIARRAPAALRQRRKPDIPGGELRRWFRWSAQQPSEQRAGIHRFS